MIFFRAVSGRGRVSGSKEGGAGVGGDELTQQIMRVGSRWLASISLTNKSRRLCSKSIAARKKGNHNRRLLVLIVAKRYHPIRYVGLPDGSKQLTQPGLGRTHNHNLQRRVQIEVERAQRETER